MVIKYTAIQFNSIYLDTDPSYDDSFMNTIMIMFSAH